MLYYLTLALLHNARTNLTTTPQLGTQTLLHLPTQLPCLKHIPATERVTKERRRLLGLLFLLGCCLYCPSQRCHCGSYQGGHCSILLQHVHMQE
jgi:hypothetical protein